MYDLEKKGGSIIGGTFKLLQERKQNPPPPRDPRLPPKPKVRAVGGGGGLRLCECQWVEGGVYLKAALFRCARIGSASKAPIPIRRASATQAQGMSTWVQVRVGGLS